MSYKPQPDTAVSATFTTGDVEIGAMEIKNGADDTRAVVTTAEPGASDAGVAVRPVGQAALIGAVAETAPATDTASSGLNGRLQRIAQRLTSLIALLPASLGGKTAAASLAVTLASDDVLVAPIGGVAETAPATDTASSGLNGRLQRIAQRITSLIALLPASLGGKAAASSFAVTTATDDPPLALLGAVTETAPATDTASSGLNGRLQRAAQRLTSLIALLPASLGGKTAAASLAVTLASDDPAVATLGATTGVKVVTDANGTIQQYLRGLVTFYANALGSGTAAAAERVTLASDDPAVATLGATTGAAVITDVNGTIQQYLRGLIKIFITAGGAQANVSQINGVTPLMGNGATGTGAIRVSIANDSTGIVALPAAGTSIVGTKAAGTAGATSGLVGAVYNSTIPTLTDGQQAAAQADTTGARRVNGEGGKATYRATFAASAIDAAGVICQVQGSASKTVRITSIVVTGKLTTGASGEIILTRYSTATSGGTGSAMTKLANDSAMAAATAALTGYTAVPTAGTSTGNLGSREAFWPAPTAMGTRAEWMFGTRNAQGLVLRGTAEFLGVRTLGFASYTGSAYSLEIEWTEE